MPRSELSERLFDDPRPEGDNQPRSLSDGDKGVRQNQAALRLLPAQKRLCADDLPGLE